MQAAAAKSWEGLSETVLEWLGVGHPPEPGEPAPRRPRGGRLALLAVAALALAAVAWTFGRGPEVRTALATTGDAAEVIYATGIVEPVNWAKVTSLWRKRIIDICKCEGEAVKKGDVLARLDDEQERASLAELESRLARLKEDAARLETLVKRNIATRVSLDDKLTQISEYQARVNAQQDRIEELALRSPLDGIVLRRDGEVGEIAGIGNTDTLLWVGQPRPLKIVADVNEDDILKVTTGQAVLLRHEGHTGAPLTATVERITPKGDPDTKTFRVHFLLPDDTPLRIGMSVEANIIVREAKAVTLLPAEAVSDHTVQLVSGGIVEKVPVEMGIRGTGMVEIRSGVKPGDRVVSPYSASLEPGQRVREAQVP